jgi:hypothetical protein
MQAVARAVRVSQINDIIQGQLRRAEKSQLKVIGLKGKAYNSSGASHSA